MTMTHLDMDRAIDTAKAAGWRPSIFKVHCPPDGLRPTNKAKRHGIPIDPTSQSSHLLCDGGRDSVETCKVMIDGDWS